MFDVKISGIRETSRALTQLRDNMSLASSAAIEEAADVFVAAAIEKAPEERHNLKDAIGVLRRIDSYDIQQIQVGVDLKHVPATRAAEVGQYASPMEEMFGYIDYAHMKTEGFLANRVETYVEREVSLFSKVSDYVTRAFTRLRGLFGG